MNRPAAHALYAAISIIPFALVTGLTYLALNLTGNERTTTTQATIIAAILSGLYSLSIFVEFAQKDREARNKSSQD